MLNKRGDVSAGSVTTELFSVKTGVIFILGALLLIGLFVVFGFIDRGQFFEKQVLAEEIVLAIESIQLFEDNAQIALFSPYDYDVEISEGTVIIGEAPSREQSRYFKDSSKTVTATKITNSTLLFLSKEGRNVKLTQEPGTINTNTLDCTRPANLDPLIAVTLDPGHGGDNTGYTKDGITEADVTRALTRRIQSFDQDFYGSSVRLDVETTIAPSKRNYGPAVVSLHLSNSSNQKPTIRAYIPASTLIRENRYLACQLLNQITSTLTGANFPLAGASIVPVNLQSLTESHPHYALRASPIAVEIEIGTINDPLLTSRLPSIATSIHTAIETYGKSATGGRIEP